MQNQIISLALALLLFNGCVLNKFAGASRYRPEELEKNLSKESRDLIDATLINIKKNNIFDYHAHVAGLGTDGSGIYINPRLKSWAHPQRRLRIKAYLSAAGIEENNHTDLNYIKRLIDLIKYNPTAPKLLLLPFDYYHDNNGIINLEKTEFSVPNEYVYNIAAQHPHYFEAAMSVHPYRKDALIELEKWAAYRQHKQLFLKMTVYQAPEFKAKTA